MVALTQQNRPSWRYERVRYLTAHNKRPNPNYDDKLVIDMWRYMLRRQRAGDDIAALNRLCKNYIDIHIAFDIYGNQVGPRWLLEAGIVANVGPEDLAGMFAIAESSVDTYEKLFFDVRPFLGHDGWVMSYIIWPVIHGKVDATDYDYMWKAIAYFGGWEFFQGYLKAGFVELNTSIKSKMTQLVHDKMLASGLVSTHVHQVNRYNALDTSTNVLDMLAKDEQNKYGSSTTHEIVEAVKDMFSAIGGFRNELQTEPIAEEPLEIEAAKISILPES